MDSLILNSDSKIYVACPANIATGGPELLHQLVYELSLLGVDAYLYYYNTIDSVIPIHDAYKRYHNKYVNIVDDNKNNYIIVPEAYCAIQILNSFNAINKIIWWLSVDNHFITKYIENKKYFFLQRVLNKILSKKIFNIGTLAHKLLVTTDMKKVSLFRDEKYLHFYQSYYAKEFILSNNISEDKIFKLSDYLNKDFLTIETDCSQKENIVAYNPKKGYAFTRQIIENAPHIKFIAIEKMTRDEVILLLQRSKVYIDFGNHPGKDRIPREAAILGCCIITNKKGSAGYTNDVPIDKKYKFENSQGSISEIIKTIELCINNFDKTKKDFDGYRNFIKSEPKLFVEDIKKIFLLDQEK